MSNCKTKTRLTVQSILTVVSDTPVKPGKTYPLSLLDHSMGLHTLHIIFYYQHHSSLATGEHFDLGRLRESLSETLSCYPPVTGRLGKDDCGNWLVKCNDAGMRVLKARVACSLDDWLVSADADEEKDLVIWEEMPEDTKTWSPFRIQVNDFVGGGVALGISCPHMQADPTCATLFMKAWTDLYHRTSISYPPFFHPPALCARENPNTFTSSVKNYEAKSILEPPPTTVKMSTATFRFSDTSIEKCMLKIKSKCPDATAFDVLSGLFWSSINRARAPTNEPVFRLSLCLDYRKKMHAPLPHGFFGNALHFTSVWTDPSNTEQSGWEHMAQIIHDHLSSVEEEEYWSVIDWFESKKDENGKCVPPFRMYGPELTCANLEHVSASSSVLEDMKPVHVSYHIGNAEGEGLILVLPSPEEGLGRTVMVTLPQDQTQILCKDSAILRLEPTIFFNGRSDLP